jgi:complex III assembly factor LYRM7
MALMAAARQTFSSPNLEPASSSQVSASGSFEELQKRIQEWRDVAVFLRRNVVQGVQNEDGAFSGFTVDCADG